MVFRSIFSSRYFIKHEKFFARQYKSYLYISKYLLLCNVCYFATGSKSSPDVNCKKKFVFRCARCCGKISINWSNFWKASGKPNMYQYVDLMLEFVSPFFFIQSYYLKYYYMCFRRLEITSNQTLTLQTSKFRFCTGYSVLIFWNVILSCKYFSETRTLSDEQA